MTHSEANHVPMTSGALTHSPHLVNTDVVHVRLPCERVKLIGDFLWFGSLMSTYSQSLNSAINLRFMAFFYQTFPFNSRSTFH